jgi:ABC-2 type transport system ATP-binding protein
MTRGRLFLTSEVIRTEALTKRYGKRRGLAGLDLSVMAGEVFGFLGPNGAGKTTTIRILLDLIRPTSGNATIFGAAPRSAGPALRRRVGYLPGDFMVNGGQSASELLAHLAHLRGGVAPERIRTLAERFDLDLRLRIAKMSKGNRQKVAVVQAFMHQPEVLILDEPPSGLDPLMQQRFLTLVSEARADGQTVFMSSHVLSEVQQSAERVGIIRDGRLVAVEEVETLRSRAVRRVEVRFDAPIDDAAFRDVPDLLDLQVDGPVMRCRLAGRADPLVKAIAAYDVVSLTVEEPDLEELFFAYYGESETDDEPETADEPEADDAE